MTNPPQLKRFKTFGPREEAYIRSLRADIEQAMAMLEKDDSDKSWKSFLIEHVVDEIAEKHRSAALSKGVYCMSEVCDSILMWAHYASAHTGMCIEYDVSPSHDMSLLLVDVDLKGRLVDRETVSAILQHVEYSSEFPSKNLSDIIDSPVDDSVLFRKADVWSYEKEWRLTVPTGDCLARQPFVITSIIFGARAAKTDIATVRNIMSAYRDVHFRKAAIDNREYIIDIADM